MSDTATIERQPQERVLLTMEEAAERLGIGRTLCAALIASGELPSIKIRRLRRVEAAEIPLFIERLRTQQFGRLN